MSTPGRNDPCPCGSGRKLKHCCLGRTSAVSLSVPDDALIHQAMQLAVEMHQGGDLAAAEGLYRQMLRQVPRHPDALHLLGLIAYQSGRHEAALELIARAIEINDIDPRYHNNQGLAHAALNRLDEAEACFRRALTLQPDFPEAWCNLAHNSNLQGKPDQVVASCYQRALALRPGHAETHYNLGITMRRLGKLDEAAACYRRALAIRPDYVEAWFDLGIVLNQQGKLDEAITCYEEALAIRPDYIVAQNNLGLALIAQGSVDEAGRYFQQPLPDDLESALACIPRLWAMLFTTGHTATDLLAAHRCFAERIESPFKHDWPVHANVRDPERRLKVGYLSPDFYHHSVAFFMEPILAHHDRSRFEIFAYYNHTHNDEVSRRIASAVDHWLPCANYSDERLAARIEADGIDVLVDLAGYTLGYRLLTFARKPAPVQVSYLGYPATTGLTAMDYRLTTGEVDPPGSDAGYSERLYRLPHTLWCYRPPTDRPVAPTPALRRGWVTFGSMNNFSKTSPAMITLWGKILRALPGTRLVMTGVPEGSARDLLYARFAAQGVDPERLVLHGRLPAREFHVLLGQIDVALDPFPYNGTTTTCEALWMGLPVITLIGQTSVSRSGYALLKAVGLPELCAADEAEYIRIAVALAGDLPRLNALRLAMRERLNTSPLRDEAGLTRDLEQAYRLMWRAWCARPAS